MIKLQTHTLSWLLVGVVFILLFWLLKPVLLPFVAGLVIAYFLAPVVNKLEKKGVPRWLGALLVLGGFGLGAALIILLVLPAISSQIGALIKAGPTLVERVRSHWFPWFQNWLSQFPQDDVDRFRDAAGQSAGDAASWLGGMLKHVITSGLALIDAVALFIILPVVAFFALRDWPALTRIIDQQLPLRYYDTIREQLAEIDTTLSGYIRGQALVCLSLGLIYSIGLTAVGLQYGLAVGVVAGVLSFIPFVGTAFGWISGLILASVQYDDWTHIGLVIGVFFFGHIMESYVLTPRLVGNRVGLHPVWVLFALIAGAKLLGFLGVLIAVPVAAVIGVLVRFFFKQYHESPLYNDIV